MGTPEYRKVTFQNKNYCVCKIQYKNNDLLFVIDSKNINKTKKYINWHLQSKEYISTKLFVNNNC